MSVVFFVVFNCFLVASLAAPPAEHNGRTFRNALNQQSLQTILQSIEERLRNLDQVYSIRYATPAINTHTDPYIRKLEILETKLSRMESQIQIQLEKISENMSSKNFKDDIAKDQLFRKIDSVYERINHKLSYVEGKLDMDILKLQTKIEAGISKIERLDHSFSVRQADMEAEISDAVEMMESVRNNVMSVENKLINITKNTIEITLEKQTNLVHDKFYNITNLIADIDRKINNSLEQCSQKDFLNDYSNNDTHLTKTFKGYEDQIQRYGNKVNNMYDELWKKSTTIENTIKNSVLLMNLTRKEIQDLKKAGHKFTTYNNQNDGQLEIIVDSFTNTIQRKFAELGRKLESNFENVMLVQNLFLESCHRIQMDESQLENKISLVLEKLLDAVTNRSSNTFKEIQSMEELIKMHDTNVYRTMNQNTNTIIKLSEKTSEDRKKLEKVLSTTKKDIGNALETIQNEISSEDQENSQKFDTIASILLELQEQVNDLDNRVNEDNINYNAKQILQDILLVTKDLPDKDTFAQKLNSTILHNVQDLSNLMSRVYHLLTSIDTKINKSYSDYHPSVHNRREEIINITQDLGHANFTNFSAKEKVVVSDAVTELADVVLEILPENNDKNKTKSLSLSRFNYTLITDNNTNHFYDYDDGGINDYVPAEKFEITENKNQRRNENFAEPVVSLMDGNGDSEIIINGNDNVDFPSATTVISVTPKETNEEKKTNIKDDNGIIINGLIPSYLKEKKFMPKNTNEYSAIIINGNRDVPKASTILPKEENTSKKPSNIEYVTDISRLYYSNYNANSGIIFNDNRDVPKASTILPKEENTSKKSSNIEDVPDINGLYYSNYNVNSGIIINGNRDVPKASTILPKEENTSKKPSNIEDVTDINRLYYSNYNANSGIIFNDNRDVPKASTILPKEENTSKKPSNIEDVPDINGLYYSNYNVNSGIIINGNRDVPKASTILPKEENTSKKPSNIEDVTGINGLHYSNSKIIINGNINTASTNFSNEKINKKLYDTEDETGINGLNNSNSNKNEENTWLKIENANKNTYYVTDSTTDMPINNKNDTNSKPGYTHTQTENDASVQNKKEISIKGFQSSASKSKNKNENNPVVIKEVYKIITEPAENIVGFSNSSNVIIGSTVADIPISDTTNKSVTIESVTKGTTEMLEETIDEIVENTTNTVQNSFEYTDLKNNTNDEHIEYEWDYED